MTNRRIVRKLLQREKNLGYKVIDDKSGFEVRSKDAVMDSNGNIVHRHSADPDDWTRKQTYIPLDKTNVPIIRAEPADVFITVSDPYNNVGQVWEAVDQNWEDLTTNWEDLV